ncbi:MAG: C39 family peptidase [Patescibacteria group bacterium]
MEKTKHKKIAGFAQVFAAAIILILAVFVSQNVRKAESSDCSLLTGDDKKKCEELEKKAEAYQDLIDIKNKQQNTLQKQMEVIDLEQSRNQQNLVVTLNKTETLDEQIQDFEKQIASKEALIKYQTALLERLMQLYYEDYQEGVLNIVLINKNFSDILNQSDFIGQTSERVKDVLATIRTAKKELETEQNKLSDIKLENEKLKLQLEDRKYDLQATETQKKSLLSKTQGEEAKYQALLARVEQQKLELFNFGASGNSADVLASVGKYPKPDAKYWASTSWYFSQRDPRWGKMTIGNSGSLMKDYGCAVAALSMVFKYYGASIDPGKMVKQPIFSYDLIKWPASWLPNIQLASSIAHTSVNWSKVDEALKKKQLVIVYVKKTSGGGGHYVVIHNKDSKDYIVHDPYFGANLYLKTTQALMGAMSPKSSTVLEQAIIYN